MFVYMFQIIIAHSYCDYCINRGYVKPKQGLVKFAVRLKGKNVEVRIATSMKNVNKGDEGASGMTDIE